MTKTLFIILLSGMLLLASGARADDNLKGVKLLCNYELYTRAVEPGRNAWTIYSPDGLEFVDRKNLILYTIAPGIDNFNLRSEKREYLALNSSIEIKKKNSRDAEYYINRTDLHTTNTLGGPKSQSPCLTAGESDSLPKILESMWTNVSTSIKSKRKI
jgi:hypothetical protein